MSKFCGNKASVEASSSTSIINGKKVAINELFSKASTIAVNDYSKTPQKSRSYLFNNEINHCSNPSTTMVTSNFFATPTQRHYLRRQQSASATLIGGRYVGSNGNFRALTSSFARFTPPPSKEISSPIYAASKFSESPSAKSLPMPPENWIQDLKARLNCDDKQIGLSIVEKGVEEDFKTHRPSFFLSPCGINVESSSVNSLNKKTEKNESIDNNAFQFERTDSLDTEKCRRIAGSESVDTGSSGFCECSSDLENYSDVEIIKSGNNSFFNSENINGNGIRINPFALIAALSSS